MPFAGRAAVLGSPVGHSLSPVLHRAAYAALGLTGWQYDVQECREDQLAAVLAAAGPDVVGYSCTMPLKRAVLAVADSASDEALAIGAGNTLVRRGDSWFADNTDWIGIRGALDEAGVAATGRVCVLGAGGTAQATLAALTTAESVTVLVREPARAADLLAAAERLNRTVTVESLRTGAAALSDAALVVSTLPVGAADVLAELSARRWRAEQALLDVVYHPWPTVLAASFEQAGATVASGLWMLLYQAARQVELMTGRAAPVPAMRAALRASVPAGGLLDRRSE